MVIAFWLGSSGHSLANDVDGKADRLRPSSYISVEGGVVLSQSDDSLAFDPADDKLGDLGSLEPGEDGWQARAEYGRSLDAVWDYRIGAGIVVLDDDMASGSAEIPEIPEIPDEFPLPPGLPLATAASQDLTIGLFDVDVGFRPEIASGMDIRVFGGLRGLAASSDAGWSDKLGTVEGSFDDDTWAIGPRIGVDLLVPLESERGIGLVGSLSGAALFGSRSTDYSSVAGNFPDPSGPETSDSFSESVTIWNVDAMAGLNVPLTDGASVTLGYKAQSFQNLVAKRSDIDGDGNYSEDGDGDVLIHGPFVKLTIPLS